MYYKNENLKSKLVQCICVHTYADTYMILQATPQPYLLNLIRTIYIVFIKYMYVLMTHLEYFSRVSLSSRLN